MTCCTFAEVCSNSHCPLPEESLNTRKHMRRAYDKTHEGPEPSAEFRHSTQAPARMWCCVVRFFVWPPGIEVPRNEFRGNGQGLAAKHIHSRVVTVRSHNLVWHASCLTQSNVSRQHQHQHPRHHTTSPQQPLVVPVGEYSEPPVSSRVNCQRGWQDFISHDRSVNREVRRKPACHMTQAPFSECTPSSFDTVRMGLVGLLPDAHVASISPGSCVHLPPRHQVATEGLVQGTAADFESTPANNGHKGRRNRLKDLSATWQLAARLACLQTRV